MNTLFEDLGAPLRRVLAETAFKTRPVDFPPFAGSSADNADRPPETLGARELREIHERATWDDRESLTARRACQRRPKK